jgi:hypothetical protein
MTIFDAATLLALAVLIVAGSMFLANHGVRALELWMAF